MDEVDVTSTLPLSWRYLYLGYADDNTDEIFLNTYELPTYRQILQSGVLSGQSARKPS